MTQWEMLARNLGHADETAMWKTLYVDRRISLQQLANQFASTPHSIRIRLQACQIPLRSRGGKNNLKVELTKELEAEIKEKGVLQTAKRLGVAPQTLYKKYYKQGIKFRDSTLGQPASASVDTQSPSLPEGDSEQQSSEELPPDAPGER